MLITKRSRKSSDLFRSRFREGRGNFPLRQYLRCREEVYSGTVHAVILAAFVVAVMFFTRSTWVLFRNHEAATSPLLRVGTLVALGVFVLFLIRKLWLKIRDVLEARRELSILRHELENLDEDQLL